MSEKIEGTMHLEGLIEGQLPPFPDARDKLEKWARNFTGGVVRISLQVEGPHFSAMPSNEPVAVKDLARDGTEPANTVADGLADLLRLFPPLERGQVFSTLRSVEYRAKLEVQTIYAVGPDGRAATRQQTVPCATVKPAEPISRGEMLKRGGLGLLAAVVILAISSLFVDYPGLWRRLTARVEPVQTAVELGNFSPYFRMEVVGLDLRNGMLLLKLTRTGMYPREEAALDALYANPPAPPAPPEPVTKPASTMPAATTAPTTTATASAPATKAAQPPSLVRRRLAVESLAKGGVWLEFHDQNGRLIGGASVRLDGLERAETIEAAVPAPVVDRQTVAPARIDVLPQ